MVSLNIETPCNNIKRLAVLLDTVDAYFELGAGFDGKVLSAAREALKGCCSACVVPNAIFKTMQVAAQAALPKEININFKADE